VNRPPFEHQECLQPLIPEIDAALDRFDVAATLLVQGDVPAAEQQIRAIEGDAVLRDFWRLKDERGHELRRELGARPAGGNRRAVPRRLSRAVFERDGWHCRYCGIRAVDPDALKKLVGLLPNTTLWARTDKERHAALLITRAVADHVEPQFLGGAEDLENLVCCCYACNFGKMGWTCEELCIADPRGRPPQEDRWDGLRRVLAI